MGRVPQFCIYCLTINKEFALEKGICTDKRCDNYGNPCWSEKEEEGWQGAEIMYDYGGRR